MKRSKIENKRVKREKLARTYGDACALCGVRLVFDYDDNYPRGLRVTFDHIIPVFQGGRNHLGNLRLAHAYCNGRRGLLEFDRCEPWMFLEKIRRLQRLHKNWRRRK